jgi:hypothetical protein
MHNVLSETLLFFALVSAAERKSGKVKSRYGDIGSEPAFYLPGQRTLDSRGWDSEHGVLIFVIAHSFTIKLLSFHKKKIKKKNAALLRDMEEVCTQLSGFFRLMLKKVILEVFHVLDRAFGLMVPSFCVVTSQRITGSQPPVKISSTGSWCTVCIIIT